MTDVAAMAASVFGAHDLEIMMLTFTDKAQEVLTTFLDQDSDEEMFLRITAVGMGPMGPRFELALVPAQERTESDEEIDAGFLKVLVDQSSWAQVDGATVDYVERVNESGFEIRPAASAAPPMELPHEAPKGEMADKVRHVLDTQVNPAVASHGGSINLVDVQGADVYIEMLGGCQGCAMSRMTLKQGVEKMLRQEIPEVGTVHDVTDHRSGDNPYF